MFRTGGELAIAQSPQFPAQGLFGHHNPKLLEQPLAEIDDTPPNYAVDGGNRSEMYDLIGYHGFEALDHSIAKSVVP